ncbi:MAG: hypothetical protein ISS58_07040 [Dehalococcoidales bacterium]|nr:hypothetical protein [Dehalococcoidales bacterium]
MRVSGRIIATILLPLAIISLALGGLLASCQPTAETETVAQAESLCNLPIPEIETMNPTENEAIALNKYDIPPIDRVAPGQTMTATFSLG